MAEVLSQSQIDALLHAVQSGEKDLNAEIIRLLNSFVVAGCTPEEMEKKKRGKKSVS